MSQVAISGNASGTGTLTIAAPNTNSNYTLTLPTNTGTLISTKSAGTVLQVVQTVKTDVFTTSSTSFVDVTGFSASITPTSATNKILVIASCYASPSLANYAILGKLVRGSTDIAIGDARGSSTRVTFSTSASSTNWSSFFGVTFLDSPATTSSTTYKVQVAAESGSTLLVGGSYTSSASYNGSSPIILTLMEIVA